jgi:hypothetical protein
MWIDPVGVIVVSDINNSRNFIGIYYFNNHVNTHGVGISLNHSKENVKFFRYSGHMADKLLFFLSQTDMITTSSCKDLTRLLLLLEQLDPLLI